MHSDSSPLTAEAIEASLSGLSRAEFIQFSVESSVESTNSSLMAMDRPSGMVFLGALEQTAGRGRRERVWLASKGSSLAFSVGIPFSCAPRALGFISLVAGMAIVSSLRSLNYGVSLKWPNDVVSVTSEGFSKVGGILVEAKTLEPERHFVVIGVGLNLIAEDSLALNVDQPISALSLLGPSPDRNAVCAALLSALVHHVREFELDGPAPFVANWPLFDALLNTSVTVHAADEVWTGIARSIDAEGRLRVEAPSGSIESLVSAEVSVRRR